MKFVNHILVISFVVFLFSIILIEGSDASKSSSKEDDEIYADVKKAFGPASDEKGRFGPMSSVDFDKFEDALEEAKEAFGPIPSFDEAKENLGPASSDALDKAKEALGPVSPSALNDAKKASSDALDKAKETLGPDSSKTIDKAKDAIASWFSQDKEEVSSDPQNEPEPKPKPEADSSSNEAQGSQEAQASAPSPLDPYGILDGAKEKFDSLVSYITKNKMQTSSDTPTDTPIDTPSGSTSKARKELGPVSRGPASAPGPGPGSSFSEAKEAIGSYSSKAMNAAKEKFRAISSFLTQNKLKTKPEPEPEIKLHSGPVFLDHDGALAVESLLQQAQTNSQLALDEAKTLWSDPTLDSLDSGKCMEKCLQVYESTNNKLNKAMEDFKARNMELLTADVSAVEGEIGICQKCFQENVYTESPFSELEEATIKATRECLNVLGHSS